MENKLCENEVVEDLCLDGLKIIQNTGLYRFTSDAVILANFVRAKRTDALLDIGTGSGCIPISLGHYGKFEKIMAVDISPKALGYATKNADENKINIDF